MYQEKKTVHSCFQALSIKVGNESLLWNSMLLTHFKPMIPFYTPWKRQKIKGFLTFSGVKKGNIGMKWVKNHAVI